MYSFMNPSPFGMQPTLLVGPNTGNLMGAAPAAAPAGLSGSAGGAMSIAGAVSSAVGAYYSARSAKNSLKHQARMAEINAQISELGAKSALLQGLLLALALQQGGLCAKSRRADSPPGSSRAGSA